MKELKEIINNKKMIEKGIKDQLDSVASTLQMIQQSDECTDEIEKILFNQIGILIFTIEELDNYFDLFNIAALTVFFISIAIVIGPTPPGTGVIAPATFSALSNSTSPHSFLFSSLFIPTSITTAPSFIISPLIKLGIPTAATRISAFFVFSARFFVFEWHIVTVPF